MERIYDNFTALCDNVSMVCPPTEQTEVTEGSANGSLPQLDEGDADLNFFAIYVFGMLLPLSLFIVVGNVTVVLAVRHHSSSTMHQQSTNTFVASLAIADCLVGVMIVPGFYLGIFVESLKSDFYLCLVIVSCLFVSCSVSMFHVLCIALDRFLAIMFPLLYHQLMTPRRTTILIILTWSAVIGVGLTPYMGWRKPVRHLEFCYIDQVLPFSYVLVTFLLTFTAPLVTMIALYTRITVAARRHARRIAASMAMPTAHREVPADRSGTTPADTRPQKSFSPGDMKAVKTTSIVVGVFVLCWLPAFIFNFIMHHRNSHRSPGSDLIRVPIVEVILNTLAFGNSAANPIIYAYRYKEFRRGIKKMVSRFCQYTPFSACCRGSELLPSTRRGVIDMEHITMNSTSVTIGER